MNEVDQRDRDLLSALQGDIAVTSTPYAIVGQLIDMAEKEVIKRAEKLKRAGHLRRMSVTFDTRALGYQTCLVGCKVKEERLERAASVINLHPGVFQNYRRNHDYALWFSIAIPPDSTLGLEKTVEMLAHDADLETARLFPTLRLWSRDLRGPERPRADASALGAEDIEFIRLLQAELPLQPRPFDAIARRASIPENRFFEAVCRFRDEGRIRYLTATLQQRRARFQTTAMAVWEVEPSRVDDFGAAVAENASVLRSYLRPTFEDWPFNIFATIQGRSVDECEAVVQTLQFDGGATQGQTLYPTKEFKNTRVSLFSNENAEWEAQHASSAAQLSSRQVS